MAIAATKPTAFIGQDGAAWTPALPSPDAGYGALLPLLTTSRSVALPVFEHGVMGAEPCAGVALARCDLGSVTIFTLHRLVDPVAPGTSVAPVCLGLTKGTYACIQREAAKMLGVCLLSEWALE